MWVLFLLDIRKNIRIRGYLYPADHISDAHPLTEIFASESVSGKIYIRIRIQQQQQQHSLFSQASWGRLEMKPERNKFKVQAH